MQDKDLMMHGAVAVPSDLTGCEWAADPEPASATASGTPVADQAPGIPPDESGGDDKPAATSFSGSQKLPPRRPGGNQQVIDGRKARAEREATEREARLEALKTTDGVLAELRVKVLEGGDTAGTQAAKQLLEAYRPEGIAECQRACCKAEVRAMPKDVRDWLDAQHEAHLRGRAAWYLEQCLCPSCGGPVADAPEARRCGKFHMVRARVPADEMQRAEEMNAAVPCELCHRHRQQKDCTCRAEEWARIGGEVKDEEGSRERLKTLYARMRDDGGNGAD